MAGAHFRRRIELPYDMARIVDLSCRTQRAEACGYSVDGIVDIYLRAEQADAEGITAIFGILAVGRNTGIRLATEQKQRPFAQGRGGIKPARGVDCDDEHDGTRKKPEFSAGAGSA
ncbi:hypothetical protein D3C71_761700 [compost metagenome]